MSPSVHEANGHRFDVGITHVFAGGPDVFFMEVHQHRAIGCDAFTNRQAPRSWHQFGGALQIDVVGIKAFFVAHGQDIPKTLGSDKCGASALALDQCIGGQCGAVDEDLNGAAIKTGLLQQSVQSFHHGQFGLAWGGHHFAAVSA